MGNSDQLTEPQTVTSAELQELIDVSDLKVIGYAWVRGKRQAELANTETGEQVTLGLTD